MLIKGIESTIYLSVGEALNSERQYCEFPNDAFQAPAHFDIQNQNGSASFVSDVPFQMTLHDAIFAIGHLSFAATQNGMMGRNLSCYSLGPQVDQYGGGKIGFTVGQMKVSNIQFVNEFQAQGSTGPTQARSYHVSYTIERPAGASPITGVDGATFNLTCVLTHDNVENRWAIDKCTPGPAGN